jgi:prophage antirepressor-like protein
MGTNNQITPTAVKTGEDEKFSYYVALFQEGRVRIRLNKISKEVFFNPDDIVKILGIGNTAEEFLSSDRGLDRILDLKKENPGKPIFGEDGMFTTTAIENL